MTRQPPFPTQDIGDIVAADEGLWASLRGMKAFITGGSGFFGRWVVESILKANEILNLDIRITLLARDVAAFSFRFPHIASSPIVELLEGDVRSFTLPGATFTHVMHLAASADAKIQAADPTDLLSVIADGTRHVLEFARQCGATRFLFASSGAVYGKQPVDLEKIPEDYSCTIAPLSHNNAYATAKRTAEQLCVFNNATSSLAIVIARGFAFVGPGLPLDGHFAAGNFMRDALAGGPIRVNGDGTPIRSYLYAADLAWWLWKLLQSGSPGTAYNVGSDQSVSIRELAHMAAEMISPAGDVITSKVTEPGALPERYVPDISRAKELGLSVRISLKESLRRTISWHVAQDSGKPGAN